MRSASLTIIAALSLMLSACAGGVFDEGFDDGFDDGAWSIDHVEDDGVVLSVWGTGPDDVWAAGGQVGRGLILHNDGTGWSRQQVPEATELLSWIYGFTEDHVYAVGERGLILHYDGESWQRVESGTDATLYGLWGAPGGDVWIAGGVPGGPDGSAVVLRGRGADFAPVALPDPMTPDTLYKIYGFHDEVLAVGTGGTVLRFDGEIWQRDEVPTDAPLFSMWGRGESDVYAVGGYGEGELLHFDGDRWQRRAGDGFSPGLGGVFTAPGEPVIAVGLEAYVLEIDADGHEAEPLLPELDSRPDLHGVWGDGAGTVYTVGGDIGHYPGPMGGVIFRRQGSPSELP